MIARSARTKDTLSSSGTRNSLSFAMRVSKTAIRPASVMSFASKRDHGDHEGGRCQRDGHAPRDEQVREQRAEHQELHRRGPLDQREVAPGVLEHHRLVDHRQLEMRGRVVHGKTACLCQRHHEERAEREEMSRAQRSRGIRHGARDDLPEIGGARGERQREDGERDGGLRERGHGHLTARPHAAEGRAGVEPGQRQEKRAEQQEIDHDDQIANGVERRGHREDRHEEGDGHDARKHDEGRRPEEPRGVARDDDLLGEQLAQLQIRLPPRRAAPVLQPRLQPANEAHHPRGEQEREGGLRHREQIAAHGFMLPRS